MPAAEAFSKRGTRSRDCRPRGVRAIFGAMREVRRRFQAFLLPAALSAAGVAMGHDSLYHYMEVRPGLESAVEVTFSIHAADLASARALGADPAGNDLAWLRGSSESEIAALLAEARTFVIGTFSLGVDGTPVDLAGALRFPAAARLSADPAASEAARPGFLAATLVLPAGSRVLSLAHAAASGKRLLLVLNRPGAFPVVRDLASGDTAPLILTSDPP